MTKLDSVCIPLDSLGLQLNVYAMLLELRFDGTPYVVITPSALRRSVIPRDKAQIELIEGFLRV
ncbi:MAG: hypothetical protein CMI51_04890, partial [Paracoccus sp.]|nr:hypothetical protein [Paracoccus sp. (in: a-proteobacteria)]